MVLTPALFQLRQIRRDIEVGVDDLGAVGSRIELPTGLRKAMRGRKRANSRRTEQRQHVPARKQPIHPNILPRKERPW